jgi:hypothetical protein
VKLKCLGIHQEIEEVKRPAEFDISEITKKALQGDLNFFITNSITDKIVLKSIIKRIWYYTFILCCTKWTS